MTASKKRVQIPVRRNGESVRRNGESVRRNGEFVGRNDEPVQEPEEGLSQSAPDSAKVQGEETVDWSDAAMRLRAEMDNFRKRQQRLAEERIAMEKKRLLTGFLGIADNLERIIDNLHSDDPYHQSIQVTYDEMMRFLRMEGVEPIAAKGTEFDPMCHDAVALLPAQAGQDKDTIVVEEALKGYRLGDQVLRPARVIVARR